MPKKKQRRNAFEWYKDNEAWVWRIMLAMGVLASFWLKAQFITQQLYWPNYKEQNARISKNEQDIEVLKERTHR